MALPKLNTAPLYELAVPSTGQTVSFRPYLVKEEKVLMMAFESGDQKHSVEKQSSRQSMRVFKRSCRSET